MNADRALARLSADPLAFLDDSDPAVRRLAVSIAAAQPHLEDLASALPGILAGDDSPRVRAEAAEVLGTRGTGALDVLLAATADPDPVVLEAIATALGEIGDPGGVPWLIQAAIDHPDRLVREATVAALGAIGDERARPVLLDLVANAPPQVRRRCVVALTVFDGEDIEAAVHAALVDRNPMVREAAEMVAGRPLKQPPSSQ